MEITRSRAWKANLGQGTYEAFDVFVSVKVHHSDLGYTDEDWRQEMVEGDPVEAIKELRGLAERLVAEQLRDEVANINKLRDDGIRRASPLGHVTE